MERQHYRHELKHYMNIFDCIQLRQRLRHVAKPDENADSGGSYKVRSLYFDNFADSAVKEKLAGSSRREKFRIRYYNDNPSFIRLEKKSKISKYCYKQELPMTAEQCRDIIEGRFDCLNTLEDYRYSDLNSDHGVSDSVPQESIGRELYAKTNFRLLRPKVIVDYTREAYVFKAGNVRITIDSDIRTSNNTAGFLDPKLVTIPAANAIVLEIKYDSFLPDVIRDIVQLNNRCETEFSKYVVSRLV